MNPHKKIYKPGFVPYRTRTENFSNSSSKTVANGLHVILYYCILWSLYLFGINIILNGSISYWLSDVTFQLFPTITTATGDIARIADDVMFAEQCLFKLFITRGTFNPTIIVILIMHNYFGFKFGNFSGIRSKSKENSRIKLTLDINKTLHIYIHVYPDVFLLDKHVNI